MQYCSSVGDEGDEGDEETSQESKLSLILSLGWLRFFEGQGLKSFLTVGFLFSLVIPAWIQASEVPELTLNSLSVPWQKPLRFIPPQKILQDKVLIAAGSTLYMLNHRSEITSQNSIRYT